MLFDHGDIFFFFIDQKYPIKKEKAMSVANSMSVLFLYNYLEKSSNKTFSDNFKTLEINIV